MWGKPNIDIISGHNYTSVEAGNRYSFDLTEGIRNAYPTKLIHCNEFDNQNYVKSSLCSDIGNHNRMWSSMFSGTMGPGLLYGEQIFNLNLYSTNLPPASDDYLYHRLYRPQQSFPGEGKTPEPYTGEYHKNERSLLTFVNPIDFTTTYSYVKSLQPVETPYYEVFLMKSTDKQKIYGWVHNRSFVVTNNAECLCNYSNLPTSGSYPTVADMRDIQFITPDGSDQSYYFRNCSPQWAYDSGGLFYNQDHFVDVFGPWYNSIGVPNATITIDDLPIHTSYDIKWFWTWGPNGGLENTPYSISLNTNNSTSISITVPPTGTVGPITYPGDWALKISKQGTKPTGINEIQQGKIIASPNPSNGVFSLTGTNGALHEKAIVRLYDVRGRLLMDKIVQDLEGYQLDLGENLSGIYILKVTIGQEESILRLVKNKE
jgi:hypothetical protein